MAALLSTSPKPQPRLLLAPPPPHSSMLPPLLLPPFHNPPRRFDHPPPSSSNTFVQPLSTIRGEHFRQSTTISGRSIRFLSQTPCCKLPCPTALPSFADASTPSRPKSAKANRMSQVDSTANIAAWSRFHMPDVCARCRRHCFTALPRRAILLPRSLRALPTLAPPNHTLPAALSLTPPCFLLPLPLPAPFPSTLPQ